MGASFSNCHIRMDFGDGLINDLKELNSKLEKMLELDNMSPEEKTQFYKELKAIRDRVSSKRFIYEEDRAEALAYLLFFYVPAAFSHLQENS